MHNRAFTLIELLITMTIIVLMALVAIPGFGKQQRLIEFQSKSEEVKSAFDEMHIKAINPEKGKAGYYAKTTNGTGESGKIEFRSYNTSSAGSLYTTITFTSNQTLEMVDTASPVKYIVYCKSGKSYCCKTTISTFENAATGYAALDCGSAGALSEDYIDISSSDPVKTSTIGIWDPFRVTVTTP